METQDHSSLFASNKYAVRLVKTDSELCEAQSLRYLVFNVELGEGLDCSDEHQRDVDEYDEQCDHLIVIERKTDRIIGTYRMQDYQQAQEHNGFYTASEFDLSVLSDDILDKSVEVGRACIHKDHRNGRVLYLLWRGIAEYIKMKSARYLFGCCSINSTDPRQGWVVMDFLKHHNHLSEEYGLSTHPDFDCPEAERDPNAWREAELPQLFRLYLSMGAEVLSKPALDITFKTIDYLVIVDVTKLDEQTRTLFFK